MAQKLKFPALERKLERNEEPIRSDRFDNLLALHYAFRNEIDNGLDENCLVGRIRQAAEQARANGKPLVFSDADVIELLNLISERVNGIIVELVAARAATRE